MAIDRKAIDGEQNGFEFHYTGVDILQALEVGAEVRVPDFIYKNDFEVVDISTGECDITYTCESSRTEFEIVFDPERRDKIQTWGGKSELCTKYITVVSA